MLTSCQLSSKQNSSTNSDSTASFDWFESKLAVDEKLTQLLYPSESDDRELEELKRRIAENPDDEIAYIKRSSIYSKLGQYENAIADGSKAIGLNESAKNYAARAFYFGQTKQYERQIVDYRRALELIDRTHIPEENIYRERGLSYFNLGQYEKAIADYKQYRILEIIIKEDSFVAGCLGSSYYYLGQYENAIAELTKAIAYAKETESSTFRRRGDAYYQLQQYDKAIEDYNRAISITPRDALNYESPAALHRKRGNLSQVEQDLAKADDLYEQYYKQYKIDRNNHRYNRYCEIPPLEDNVFDRNWDKPILNSPQSLRNKVLYR